MTIMQDEGFIYLATPYSSTDEVIRKGRTILAVKHAAKLIKEGNNVFCPIAYNVGLCKYSDVPMDDSPFWMNQDKAFLKKCSKLVVVKMWGWEHSKGILEEIELAKELGIPIEYIEDDLYNVTGNSY